MGLPYLGQLLALTGAPGLSEILPPLPATPFQATLYPASFRGVPFIVEDNSGEFGRRGSLHEYPFRDIPYAEDLGRRARRFSLQVFVLGDDCAAQRDALLNAMEQFGPGLLVHPSMGSVMVQPDPQRPSRYRQSWDAGRRIDLELSFVEPGQVLYPGNNVDTQAASQTSGDDLSASADQDFSGGVAQVGTANQANATSQIGSASANLATANQDYSGGIENEEGQVIPIPPANFNGSSSPLVTNPSLSFSPGWYQQ
jgi:prophage DNA circulation protein